MAVHEEHCPLADICDRRDCSGESAASSAGAGLHAAGQGRSDAPEAPDRRAFLQAAAMVALTFGLTNVWTATGRAAGTEKAYPIPPGDGVTLDRDAQVLLVRYQGKVFALSLTCPHQNAAVRWLPGDGRFQCTRHDSKYQPDGTYTSGRATRNMDRLPIRRDGGQVLVDVTQIIRADQNAAGWAAAAVSV